MSDLADTITSMRALTPPVFDRMVGTVVSSSPLVIDDGKGHRITMTGQNTGYAYAVNAKALALNVQGKWYALAVVS